jgi:hypothetical protein
MKLSLYIFLLLLLVNFAEKIKVKNARKFYNNKKTSSRKKQPSEYSFIENIIYFLLN